MRKLRSKKKRFLKKYPDGYVFTEFGFKPSRIMIFNHGGEYVPDIEVVSFDRDGFTLRYNNLGGEK